MGILSRQFRTATGHVGVSFEDDTVRMLQVREDRGHLGVTGASLLRYTDVESTRDSLSESIRAAFVTGGFTGRKCVVSMPRSEVWTQTAKLPDMPDSELDEAVAWEAAERFGVSRDSLECDWIRVGGETGQDVFIMAADRSRMTPRLEAVLAAGMRPVAVDTDFGGVSRLFARRFRRDVDADRARAVLDVADSGSMLLILRGQQIVFCKPVSGGGRHLDARVAERLDLETSAANALRAARLNNASSLDPSTDGAVADAAKPGLAELSREAMLCLRHFSVAVRGDRPDHLVLTGTHAAEPGLASMVESACRVPVLLDDDSNCIEDLRSGLAKAMPSISTVPAGWAAVAGLSLRGVTANRCSGRRAA